MASPWKLESRLDSATIRRIVELICDSNDMKRTLNRFDSFLAKTSRGEDFDLIISKVDYNSSDLDINTVSEIAYQISMRFNLVEGNGVVLTPYPIAKDMVRMCLLEWLCCNQNTLIKEDLRRVLWPANRSSSSDVIIKDLMGSIKWFDPCVGGGVFIRAIIDIYEELEAGLPQVTGCDINPFFVVATKHQLDISGLEESATNIFVGDFLLRRYKQLTLFTINDVQESYDIVIGNPPYVQYDYLRLKNEYCRMYPEIAGKKADLYTFFIANGLFALRDNGVIGFITPAQFQKSKYGEPIRSLINREGNVRCIFDFDELPVFDGVSIHTSIFCIQKGEKQADFLRYEYDTLPEKNPILVGYEMGTVMEGANVSTSSWNLSSSNAHIIFAAMEAKSIPLRQYVPVLSGIKSGCKQALFIKSDTVQSMDDEDRQYIKKILFPKKIRTWYYLWENDYIIVIPKNITIEENSKLYKYLLPYREMLEKRDDVKNHGTWYGLRECNYYDKLLQPKIIYPDIATECRFAIDTEGYYITDGAFFIPCEDYYLLGVLNSCVGRYYFREKCARIGNPTKGGRIRFKKVYVENFPIIPRQAGSTLSQKIDEIAQTMSEQNQSRSLQAQLDQLVLQLYNIPKQYHDELMEV